MTALRPIAAGEISIARMQAQIDGALRMLAASTNPAEIVTIHSMAEAIRYAAKRAKLGLGAQNCAAELRLRAERRLRDLLRDRLTRGRPRSGENVEPEYHYGSVEAETRRNSIDIIRLDDLGISRDLSARSQRIAAIPATKFESYFLTAREAGWEITWGGTNGLIYRAETDMFDLTRQRRRNGAEYNPFNRRPQSEFAPSTPPVVTI